MEVSLYEAGEGSSRQPDFTTEIQIKEELEEFNTMDFLELAASVQATQDPIDFNSTDAMENPKTGQMCCMHCLQEVDKSQLYDHMVNEHNYRRLYFKCHICQSVFKERFILIEHRKVCKPIVKRKIRKSINQLLKEVDDIISEDIFDLGTCPVCLIEIPKKELKQHLVKEHDKPDPDLTCPKCQRTFKSKLTLREHIKLVHLCVEESEECEMCGQKFRSQKYLANHKRNVHPSGDKVHKCHICDKVFKSRLCLHQHIKYVHPPESAMVECTYCPKIFKSKINLGQHLKVSHGVYSNKANLPAPVHPLPNSGAMHDQSSNMDHGAINSELNVSYQMNTDLNINNSVM